MQFRKYNNYSKLEKLRKIKIANGDGDGDGDGDDQFLFSGIRKHLQAEEWGSYRIRIWSGLNIEVEMDTDGNLF